LKKNEYCVRRGVLRRTADNIFPDIHEAKLLLLQQNKYDCHHVHDMNRFVYLHAILLKTKDLTAIRQIIHLK